MSDAWSKKINLCSGIIGHKKALHRTCTCVSRRAKSLNWKNDLSACNTNDKQNINRKNLTEMNTLDCPPFREMPLQLAACEASILGF